jgi:hypothetical protein
MSFPNMDDLEGMFENNIYKGNPYKSNNIEQKLDEALEIDETSSDSSEHE